LREPNFIAAKLVSSRKQQMKHSVYLALGSNLGDRAGNLRAAVDALAPQVIVSAESKIYETPPWGYEDQPAFLNMAVKAETDLEPASLLKHLKELEVHLGRAQSFRWGPRLIDIDILFDDDRVVDTPSIVIPHPRLHERAFVLIPLADIAPDFVHPVLKKTIRELLRTTENSRGIIPYSV
jgi:2-amino-4-hydroxy-6-hydroxymethyldihydropteridine diphosphokinase